MILVFDFGATRIKSSVAEVSTGELKHSIESDGGSRAFGALVPGSYFADTFREHLNAHVRAAGRRPSSIWIASEMHGFLIADRAGNALTPYISWRSNIAHNAGKPELSHQIIASWGDEFLSITGMRPRIGLPAVNLVAMQQLGQLPRGGRLIGIPEWIVLSEGRWSGFSHLTLAASFGLMDLATSTWSQKLSRDFGEQVALPDISSGLARPLGWITVDGQEVSVHGGVGDLQAALAGLHLASDVLSLNMGTGSQVSRRIGSADRADAELRPFFDNTFLRTQTHIAAGRSLAAFSDLFDEIAGLAGGTIGTFWRIAAELAADEVATAKIAVDPAIFESAWGFSSGGSLSRLVEGRMGARDLVAAICKGWLEQYVRAAALVDPAHETATLLLSGGLPRRIPFVAPTLTGLFGRKALLAAFDSDETLHGLVALAATTH